VWWGESETLIRADREGGFQRRNLNEPSLTVGLVPHLVKGLKVHRIIPLPD
jgi:hypothetical protein